MFNFVSIKNRDRKQLFQRISEITNIEYTEVKQCLEHTEKSRSKDFLNANILIVSVEDLSSDAECAECVMGELYACPIAAIYQNSRLFV